MNNTEKKYCVYMHTNKTNGKKYIGITSMKPSLRWGRGSCYKRNAHFYSSINKYGWDGFLHEILYEGLSKEEACELEKELIAKYNTLDAKCGYNLNEGGTAPTPTEETRKKISNINKGRVCSEETRRKISESNKGRKLSFETKEKLRAVRLGTKSSLEAREKISLNSTKSKAVYCDGKHFRTIQECAKYYNVGYGKMKCWLNGIQGMPEEFYKMGLSFLGKEHIYKPIQQVRIPVRAEDLEFESLEKCAQYYNITRFSLKEWLDNPDKMPQEFKDKNLHAVPVFIYQIVYTNKINDNKGEI